MRIGAAAALADLRRARLRLLTGLAALHAGPGYAAYRWSTGGTTESINLVMHGYGRKFIGAGDEIILTTLEHHSNIVPWQMLA